MEEKSKEIFGGRVNESDDQDGEGKRKKEKYRFEKKFLRSILEAVLCYLLGLQANVSMNQKRVEREGKVSEGRKYEYSK